MLKRRSAAAALCAVCFAASALFGGFPIKAQSNVSGGTQMQEIIIDGNTANTAENSEWRGFGFISANNSSRLLLDYKAEDPDEYYKLLNWLFDPNGAIRMNHIKLEMGADINSSSGTEPSTKRAEDEAADVTRGAGFQLAADALAINPDITLELLSWGAPGYIKNTEDNDEKYRLRYMWFKETLDAAYETYGLRFQYIDPNYNEKIPDVAWIKYFSSALKSETDTPYPYDEIKIVAADEDVKYNVAQRMLIDEEFMDAVDVIGIHYTSTSDENTLNVKKDHGKELWYSEGLSPAVVEKYAVNADGSGLKGVNSMLDVAGRIINMYPNGGFTMYQFQPAVAAYYSGATYFPKQLVTANEPWSGYLEVGSGLYMCAHFSLFTRKGWQFVDSACAGDGREENHVLYDTTNNIMTLADPETGDYTAVLANNTDSSRSYTFTVKNLDKASSQVYVWETRGPDEGQEYNANYLKNTMTAQPEENGDGYTYSVTVKPNSLVTVTTVEASAPDFSSDARSTRLELPYTDDFEYADFDENYLASRGYAPRYTTDQGGAFEVVETETDGRVLRQQISEDMRGVEWGSTPYPVTTLGDDCWANYTVSAKVKLAVPEDYAEYDPESSYVGIGLRYINSSAAMSNSGYRILMTASGKWQLKRINETLAEGDIEGFKPDIWHELSITAMGDNLSATVDGIQVVSMTLQGEVTFSGRAALYSSYDLNCFDDLAVSPVDMTNYVTRVDDLDPEVSFDGEWEHNIMDGFTCHNRTSSTAAGSDAGFSYSFIGDSLAIIGTASNDTVISVKIDGTLAADNEKVSCLSDKGALWHRYSLGYGEHDVKVTVHSGTLKFDAIEFGSKTILRNGDPSEGYVSETEDIGNIDADSASSRSEAASRGKEKAAAAVTAAAVIAGAAAINKKRRKK